MGQDAGHLQQRSWRRGREMSPRENELLPVLSRRKNGQKSDLGKCVKRAIIKGRGPL